ncbi:MAG: hypothetical protein U5Q16_14785 [Gammaproteobacteria bacterium]|nr:hypothetical protein [Gammaproteobacteria bacterium]
MMLESGQWLGRGSVLVDGHSRGAPVACHVSVERDAEGATLTGDWQADGESATDFQVRLARNDAGTYTLTVYLGGDHLQGTAKLDSPPNLGLLWNDSGTLYATFALFSVPRGYGFRGFVRDAGGSGSPAGSRVFTWEIAFSLKQEVLRGDNVVSLRRRR